jgi:hypothetical protein
MTTNLQNTPYLPRQRNFPNQDSNVLSQEVDKTYIEMATRINEKTIGIYAVNFPIVTGNQWFLTGSTTKQQTLRQVYNFTTTTDIAHGIPLAQVQIANAYGQFTDGKNWYGLIFASNVSIIGQRTFYIDPVNINFLAGAGAPALTSGFIVIEWISQV